MADNLHLSDSPRSYDVIQMLNDYLVDNKDTAPNFRNFLINRLGDQITWYDKKSAFFKKRWERYRRVVIILSASIPFLVGLMDQEYLNDTINVAMKIAIGLSGVIIAVLEGFNALYKSQELYIAYRVTAERLRHEFSSFLGQVGDYGAVGAEAFPLLVANVEAILASENNQWADLTRKTERAAMSEDVEKWVSDYLEKRGFKKPDTSGQEPPPAPL